VYADKNIGIVGVSKAEGFVQMNKEIFKHFKDALLKEAKFSGSLDNHPALKGKQSKLPDKIQAGIIKKKLKMSKQAAAVATKTDPAKWEAAKTEAKSRMGGKHSARAMQLATKIYKKKGGGYSGAKPSSKNNSLKKWSKQKWGYTGKDKPGQGGSGVYLPENKRKRLKSTKEGRKQIASASAKKAKATREGKQYSSHGLAAGTSLAKKASAVKIAHMCRKDILDAFKAEGGALSMKALIKRTSNQPLSEVKKELLKLKKEGIVKVHPHGDMYTDMVKKAEAKKDPRLVRAGVSGYNVPKRTPGHGSKSHIVVAKEGDTIKTLRFGQQGVKTNQTAGQREAFKSRHAKNIAKGKLSRAYWADKVKWSSKKTKDPDNKKWVKGS